MLEAKPDTYSTRLLAGRAPAPRRRAGYSVDIIDDIAALGALQPEWDALYARDPESGFFLSFRWLASIFAANPGKWQVHAVRDSAGALACLFPVRRDRKRSRTTGAPRTELRPGGRLTLSEYTGFICDPAQADAALTALARHIQRQDWAAMSMRYEASERRAEIFAAAFSSDRFRVIWHDYFINNGETDCLLCPRIALPADFDSYLATRTSSNTRQKIRRFRRKHIDSGALHVTFATPRTHARDIAILGDLWAMKWSQVLRPERVATSLRRHRRFFDQAIALGVFHLPLLWRGDQPLGGLAGIVDRDKGHLYFKMAGRDETVNDVPTGLLLHAHNIEWAIENRLSTYDFGHGNEPYKYSFGAVDTRIRYFSIRREPGPGATA